MDSSIQGAPEQQAEGICKCWSEQQILEAFNRAADETIGMNEFNEALADAVNMVVNLGMSYLENPAADQDDVIEEAWGTDDPDEMRGWVAGV